MTMSITPIATAGTTTSQKSPSFTGKLDKAAKTVIDATIKEFKIENKMNGIGRKIGRYATSAVGTVLAGFSTLATIFAVHIGLSGVPALAAFSKYTVYSNAVEAGILTGIFSSVASLCNRKAMNLLPQFAEKLKTKGLTPEQVKAGLKRYIGQTGYPIYSRLFTRSAKLDYYAGTAAKA